MMHVLQMSYQFYKAPLPAMVDVDLAEEPRLRFGGGVCIPPVCGSAGSKSSSEAADSE